MITIKSKDAVLWMRRAGQAAAAAREAAGAAVAPGVTTAEIDEVVRDTLKRYDAVPSFLHYNGYPAAVCISVNEEVIHGIPGKRVLRKGDLVKIDVGAQINGYHGDTAETFYAGSVSDGARRLTEVTRQCFDAALQLAVPGNRISDLSHAVQSHAEKNGYGVVRMFTGHGIGAALHEDPEVPNFGKPGRGPRLVPGMTLAIEPMINAGTAEVDILSDKWTVVTRDKRLSAHYEHTVLITEGAPEILTADRAEER